MTLIELKKAILENSLTDELLILLCEENYFIAEQYVKAISEKTGKTLVSIDSITQLSEATTAIINTFSDNLNILRVDCFSELLNSYSEITNCIIICSKIDKAVEKQVADYIIKIPKLLDWQIKDYMAAVCSGLDEQDINWLYSATQGNIYRLENELTKINLFRTDEQSALCKELKFSKQSDLYSCQIFDLLNAILLKNKSFLYDFMQHRASIVEPDAFALITLLLNNLKRNLFVCYVPQNTAEQLGISQAQFNYIKNHPLMSKEQLIKQLEFFIDLDLALKTGRLVLDNADLLDFIIGKSLCIN